MSNRLYYTTDKGLTCDTLFMALRLAREEGLKEAEKSGSVGSPFSYNPTFDEVWRYFPSGVTSKKDAAKVFSQMLAAGLVASAPYRGYSPYLVPEAAFRDEWNRRFAELNR